MLRPLRLIRIQTDQLATFTLATNTEDGRTMGSEEGMNIPQDEIDSREESALLTPAMQEHTSAPDISQEEVSHGETEARRLLRRTPMGYFLNQAYGFWTLISLF
jgi:hypothetical protein